MRYPPTLLPSIVSSVAEGIVVSDAKGNLLIFNKAARRIFDPKLMNRHFRQWPRRFGLYLSDGKTFFPVDDLPLIRAIRGKNTDGLELFVRNHRVPHGIWINLSGRPLLDAAGKVIGAVALFRDITESKKAEQDIVEISGREQRRIGQDLHDGLCQTLLATQFTLRVLAGSISKTKAAKVDECLEEMREHLRNAIAQADVIARGLYPVELDTQGLMAALSELARNMSRIYRIDCAFECPKPVKIPTPTTASHLYRIGQEAVSNAIKGGKAARIRIRLEQKPKTICLSILDNGRGMPKGPCRNGMGLALMAYRARMINATLKIQRRAKRGMQVVCAVPRGIPDAETL
jgi:signal transduction histidine kinase